MKELPEELSRASRVVQRMSTFEASDSGGREALEVHLSRVELDTLVAMGGR